MAGFVDIHNHILPGIDDGPRTLDESLEMARMAVADGVTDVLATPHSQHNRRRIIPSAVATALAQFQEQLAERSIPLRLHQGMEVLIELDLVGKVETGLVSGIAGGKYLLLELPYAIHPNFTEEIVFSLQLKGFTVVLAHAERHTPFRDDLGKLRAFVERGALAQVTTTSLVGGFGKGPKQAAEAMLQQGLAHIIASDTHGAKGHRTPVMSAGVAAAAKLVGEALAMEMASTRPLRVVKGEPVTVSPPEPVKRRRWFFWG